MVKSREAKVRGNKGTVLTAWSEVKGLCKKIRTGYRTLRGPFP